MKISLEWLNEFVDISDLTVEQIVHELTMSGLEVEEIESVVLTNTSVPLGITTSFCANNVTLNKDRIKINKSFLISPKIISTQFPKVKS